MLAGCTSLPQEPVTEPGAYRGKVAIAWDGRRDYVYIPVASRPLEYTFPAQIAAKLDPRLRTIRPHTMRTDAGSIPRVLWSVEGLAPLDYLPAYVVHDWLYMQNRCHKKKRGPYRSYHDFPYSREQADQILREMLDQIDSEAGSASNPAIRKMIFSGVKEFGDKAWTGDAKTECDPVEEFEVVIVKRRQLVPDKSLGQKYVTVSMKKRVPLYKTIVTVGN